MRLFRSVFKAKYIHELNLIKHYLKFSTLKMSKNALLLLANGAEEMEVVITADVLRRAGVLLILKYLLIFNIIICNYVK